MSSTQASRIALIGSPNSGKSLLFNRLTGLNQKVANFPGITVNIASGQSLDNNSIQYLDFPGVYSLQAISGEEKVAVEAFTNALEDNLLDAVICVVDSTRLEKGLIFALQVLETCHKYNKPVLIAANMVDVLDQHGMRFDGSGLSEALKVAVLPLSAKSGAGLEQISQSLADSNVPPEKFQSDIIASDDSVNHLHAQELAEKYGPKGDLLINTQTRLDSFFLHSWLGGLSFLVIMYLLFQSIFTWAAPVMDAVEASIQWLASVVLPLLPVGVVSDFTSDALFGGIGAFLVFVPQIFVLTLVVGMLEDSGYLARAAVICHKPLRFFWPHWQELYPYALRRGLCYSRRLCSAHCRVTTQALADLFGNPSDALFCSTACVQPDYCRVYTGAKGHGWTNWLAGSSYVWYLPFWYSLRPASHCCGVTQQCRAADRPAFCAGDATLPPALLAAINYQCLESQQALCNQGWQSYFCGYPGYLGTGLFP